MSLHPSTFEYLKPTDEQLMDMDTVRGMFRRSSPPVNFLVRDSIRA